MNVDPPADILRAIRCPTCQKMHALAHSTDAHGVLTCPCGTKINAFTGRVVDKS